MKPRKMSDSNLQSWWRKAVIATWGGRCAHCGFAEVECHHIVKRRHAMLRNDYRNGIPLCKSCHAWAETLKGRAWVYMQVDMDYLSERERVNIKDYLQQRGITRYEFDEMQLAELKECVYTQSMDYGG